MLSIIIPTLAQKKSIFKTIESIQSQLSKSHHVKVEVVVNPIKPNRTIIERLKADSRITTRFHSRKHRTAESSAFWAAKTSNSNWVWILGDDDTAKKGSIEHVISLTAVRNVKFWLLNLDLVFTEMPISYYKVGPEPIQISSGHELWQKCGFFSLTTTLSCFLIERQAIDIDLFMKFHDVQGIYSHSFALFAMLINSNVGITNHVCVRRNESSANLIRRSLNLYSSNLKRNPNYIWTDGAMKLFKTLSNETGLDLKDLLKFREIEIIREEFNRYLVSSDLKLLVSTSGGVVWNFFSRTRDRKISDSYAEILEDFAEPGKVYAAPVRITLSQN